MSRSLSGYAEDELDAAIRREAAAVRSVVETDANTDDAWARFEDDLRGTRHPQPFPRRPVTMIVAALLVAAAVVAIVVLNVRRQPTPTDRLPTPTTEPSRVTTSAPPTTAPATTPTELTLPFVSAFSPITSLSAVSDREWWAATAGDLRHTFDAGASWAVTDVDGPSIFTDGQWVHFADARNGWVLTTNGWLTSTHDGGATWVSDPTVTPVGTDGFPPAIASRDGGVHLLADCNTRCSNSAIVVSSGSTDGDRFTQSDFTMGNIGRWTIFPNSAQLALQRDTGWAVAYGLSTNGSARLVDGTWVEWSPPCARDLPPPSSTQIASVPVAQLLLAASPEGSDVAVVCVQRDGDQAPGERLVSLFLSHDGAESFGDAVPLPTDVDMVWDLFAMEARPWVLVPADGTVLVGTPLTNGEFVIESSTDGGATWQVVTSFGAQTSFGPVTVTPTGRIVVVANAVDAGGATAQTAQVSDDGGATWAAVTFG